MYLLYVILNEVDYLDEILEKFIELGVKGATILDSQGMGRAIVDSNIRTVPLFGYLKSILDDSHPYNKTIMTVIHNKELLDKTVLSIRELMEDDAGKGAGFMFAVPIEGIYTI